MGTDGADTLSSTNESDLIFAGAGDDKITAKADDIVFGGTGSDTLMVNENLTLDFDKLSSIETIDLGTGATNNTAVTLTITDILSDGQAGNETITIHGDSSDKVTIEDTSSTTVTETTGTPTDSITILDGSNSAVIDTILIDNAIIETIHSS